MYIVTVQDGPHSFKTLFVTAATMPEAWAYAVTITNGVVTAVQFDPSIEKV